MSYFDKNEKRMKVSILFTSFLVFLLSQPILGQTDKKFIAPSNASGNCYNYEHTCGCNNWCNDCKHAGKDYCGTISDDIKATGSGRVMYVSNANDGSSGPNDNRGFGRTVIIAHKMAGGINIYSLYAHLNSIGTNITQDKYVTKGFVIGKKGKSGGGGNNVVHLHFEMKNHQGLGHFPDCTGTGCVGYVKSNLLPVSSRGYFNPNHYIGIAEYLDIAVNSSLPSTISKSGVTITTNINSPFTEPSTVDLRLALYNSSGTYLGDIQQYLNRTLNSGYNNITFSKTALTSSVGSNYKLQIDYKVPGSTTWIPMPTISPYQNPKNVAVTN